MQYARYLAIPLIVGVLGGCQSFMPLTRMQSDPKEPFAPAPLYRTVENVTNIGHLTGPSNATVSQPVTIALWAYVGTNTCSSLGSASLWVDEASQSATVRATAKRLVGDDLLCGMMYPGFVQATLSFTPSATGTYQVTGEPFQAIPSWERYKIGKDVIPAATLTITVEAPTASVLPNGEEDYPSQE